VKSGAEPTQRAAGDYPATLDLPHLATPRSVKPPQEQDLGRQAFPAGASSRATGVVCLTRVRIDG